MARTFIANHISEDQIEKAIISVFVDRLGYRHINCFTEDLTGRSAESEVVIEPILRKKLTALNPNAPAYAVDKAVEQLTKTRLDQQDLQANKELYFLIRDGISVQIKNDQHKNEPITVKVIDFADETRNDYLIVSQLWVKGQYIRRRPDLILFVNGCHCYLSSLKTAPLMCAMRMMTT